MYREKETTKNKFSTDDALYRVLKKQLTTHKKTGNKWEIFGLIKRFPKLFCLNFQDPEEQANFNDWIEEKLDTILNSYNPRISSFYIFLNNTLNFYLRNYKKFANRKKAAMYAFMYDSGKSIIIENTEPRLFYENTAADPTVPYLTSFVPDKLKLWLIILGLKCADYLDGDLKYKLCSITGFEEAHLDNLIGTLKESYKTRQAKIEGLKEILYKYYIKTYNIQYQIKNATFDETEELEKLKTRLSEYKIRQQKILQRLNQIKKPLQIKKLQKFLTLKRGLLIMQCELCWKTAGLDFIINFVIKSGMKIYLASSNIHKKKEISEILPEYTVLCPGDMNIEFNPEENGSSFTENALIKAKALWEIVNEPVLADDSGICVDALNGEPGIYSSRYGSTPAHKLSQEEQNCLLLEKMKGNPHRNCRFVCAMVLYLEKDRYYVIQETLEGTLAEKPIGKGGFGYDPLVFLPDLNKTVAQLTEEEKNNISHRGKALKILKKLLA